MIEYIVKIKTEFEIIDGPQWVWIMKNEGRKSRDTLQLNEPKDNTYVLYI